MVHTRPTPILVKFLLSFDTNPILSNHSQIPPPFVIKPDMSHEDRNTEFMLLRERWNVIQQGSDQRTIKIHNKQIYVANQLFRKVQNSRLINFIALLIGYPDQTLLNTSVDAPLPTDSMDSSNSSNPDNQSS